MIEVSEDEITNPYYGKAQAYQVKASFYTNNSGAEIVTYWKALSDEEALNNFKAEYGDRYFVCAD